MGIGNVDVVPPVWLAKELITPHGDWKRASNGSRPATSEPSLPLMGIGNRVNVTERRR